MRITPLVLLAALALGAAPARAQTFGTFTGAEPLPVNGRMVGIYLQTSENVAALVSQLRLSFYPGIDFGFAGGFARQDFGNDESRTNLRVGGDMKFAIKQPSEKWPFSMALDAALGIETGDDFTILTFGPKLVGSRAFATGENSSITPYAAIGLLFSNVDIGANSDSDLSFPLHLGAVFKISPQVELNGELQLRIADSFNDDIGLSFGVNLPF